MKTAIRAIPAALIGIAFVGAQTTNQPAPAWPHLTISANPTNHAASASTLFTESNAHYKLLIRVGRDTQPDGVSWYSLRAVVTGSPRLQMRGTNALTILGEENRIVFPAQTSVTNFDENGIAAAAGTFTITADELHNLTLSETLHFRIYGETGYEDFAAADAQKRLKELSDYAAAADKQPQFAPVK